MQVCRAIPTTVRQSHQERLLERALETAIESNVYFHLWTRLYNIWTDVRLDPVVSFFETLGRTFDPGSCRLATMCEFPALDRDEPA
jgi:hypothetical protein